MTENVQTPQAPQSQATPQAPPAAVAPAADVPAQPQAQTSPPAAPAAQQPPAESRTVPLEVIEKMRSELQAAKAKAEQAERQAQLYNEQISLYRANAPQQPQHQPQAPQQAAAELVDLLDGVKDDTLLEAAHVRQALKKYDAQQQQYVRTQIQNALGGLMPKLTEIELTNRVPNYQQLIKDHLPTLISENPMVMDTIKSSSNPLVTAVQFAKTRADMLAKQQAAAPAAQTTAPTSVMDEISRIIENQGKPGNPGTGVGTPAAAVSLAQRIGSMSSEEFAEMKEKVKRGEAFR
jgi:hypothetical protein